MVDKSEPVPVPATYNYGGIARAIKAPNRYRKLLKDASEKLNLVGSPGCVLFALASTPEGIVAINEALSLQKIEWPSYAERALGIEPDFFSNLTDIVLLWDGTDPII